ncbi:MAG TPA: hypothetical protein VLW06_03260 [Terriglobales bacterium]|nr:hypothetical protein [Terriglobales bacterium]
MGLRRATVLAGALIILPIAALTAYRYWLQTRIPIPLRSQVSLNPGHIKTQQFPINLRGRYFIEITIDYPFTYMHPECPMNGDHSVLQTHTKLFRGGVLVGEPDGEFVAERSGLYSLDIEVQPGASCLNAAHPMLKVVNADFDDYANFYKTVVWIAWIPVVAGLGLFWVQGSAAIGVGRTKTPVPVMESAFGTSPLALPIPKPLSALPHFGFYCGTVLAFVVFAMMILRIPMIPKGVRVSLIRPAVTLPPSGFTAIVVRVTDLGPWTPAGVSINGKEVGWGRLSGALKDELKTQPNWVVYVDADPNVPWQSAVNAMDVAKGLHAKVILLTPETRQQLGAN